MSWITEEDRIARGDYDTSSYQPTTIEVRFFRPDGSYYDKSVKIGTQEEYASSHGVRAGMASWNYGPNRKYQ